MPRLSLLIIESIFENQQNRILLFHARNQAGHSILKQNVGCQNNLLFRQFYIYTTVFRRHNREAHHQDDWFWRQYPDNGDKTADLYHWEALAPPQEFSAAGAGVAAVWAAQSVDSCAAQSSVTWKITINHAKDKINKPFITFIR